MNLELMWESLPKLLGGVPETLGLVAISCTIGLAVAVMFALMRLSGSALLSRAAGLYVYIFRSTPLLVQIFLIYYGSGQFRHVLTDAGLWAFFREPWCCAILALTLNTAAYTCEIIRGGIQSVAWGQIEAGHAIGMSKFTLFRRIVMPQAVRQALPAYGNEVILIVKSTSLAGTITILEITGIAKKIIAATFSPVEIFVIAGILYLGINSAVTFLVAQAERRLSPASARAKAKRKREKHGLPAFSPNG